MLRYILATIIALGCAMCVTGCSKDQEKAESEPVPQTDSNRVVMTVNDETIADEDVAMEVSRLMQMRSRGLSPDQLESTRRALRSEAAGNVLSRMLLNQEVQKQGIEIPDEKVEERLRQIKEDFGSEEVFNARIARMNMTEDDVRREVATGLAIEQLIEKQTAFLPPPGEQELMAYYNEHIDWYTEPEKVRASHILLKFNPGDDDKVRAEKKAGAQELLEKVRGGANFAQLAVEHSDCPSKSRGGDLDFFSRGMMVKEFEDVAFALDVGEVSDLVETQFGYHIIKATDRKQGRVVPFAEVAERVKTDFGNETKQQAVNDYLERLKTAAKIEYADSSLID
ncbi:MAG TPA: peptidylprolyl isomerase [Patescibacteria group bacterium]|nr:peptidylprolyl isomerase [Patescibacteria group bacterium]